jgi:MGT family glycosyltransferase
VAPPEGPFRHAVDGVAELDVRVVVTVGPEGDPRAFGSLPDNVSVHRYVPQTELLPRSTLVVSHAGSGTFLAALGHGLPQLCLPQAADQFLNAQQCDLVGAGLRLAPGEITRESVRGACARLLEEERFRASARRIRDELDSMPHPADLVPMIEELAATAGAPLDG